MPSKVSFIKFNFLLFLLIVSLLILSLLPYLYRSFITLPGRVYLGAEEYYPDYYGTLFHMRLGAIGAWTPLKIFSYPLAHFEQPLMGWIGGLFSFPVDFAYHFFRLLLIAALLSLSYVFISYFFVSTKERLIAFLLSFFVGALPIPAGVDGFGFKTQVNFFQPADILARLVRQPHHLIGSILTIGIFLVFFHALRSKKLNVKYSFLVAILALFSGLVHATSAIFFVFTAFIYLSLIVFFRKKLDITIKTWLMNALILGSPLLLFVVVLVYFLVVFNRIPYLAISAYAEKAFSLIDARAPFWPLVIGYFVGLGPLIILSLVGLRKFWQELDQKRLFVIAYLLAGLAFFFVGFLILGVSRSRFHQTPFYLPWAVLATYGFFSLSAWFHQRIKRVKLTTVHWSLFTGLLLLSLPTYANALNLEFTRYGVAPNLDPYIYPKKGWFEAISWLGNNSCWFEKVLAEQRATMIIPAFSGNIVYWPSGDEVYTGEGRPRLANARLVLTGTIKPERLHNLLVSEKISLIFIGEDEREMGAKFSESQDFLSLIFKNDEASIYEVVGVTPELPITGEAKKCLVREVK